MGSESRALSRFIAIMLVCTLLVPAMANAAPKPLTSETVHTRILKAGLGNFAAVQLQDGVAFGGRIVSIDDQSFSMQLHNDPEVTAVFYRDVVQLNTGISHGAFWTILGVGIGGVVAMTVVGIHEVNKHSQMPTMPTLPTSPIFP